MKSNPKVPITNEKCLEMKSQQDASVHTLAEEHPSN